MRRSATFAALLLMAGMLSAASYTLVYQGFPYKRTSCELPTYESGVEIMLPSANPVQDGKPLKGWQYGEEIFLPGTLFVMPEADVVLLPVWDEGTGVGQSVRCVTPVEKILRDGQLLILRDNKVYNLLGESVQ